MRRASGWEKQRAPHHHLEEAPRGADAPFMVGEVRKETAGEEGGPADLVMCNVFE